MVGFISKMLAAGFSSIIFSLIYALCNSVVEVFPQPFFHFLLFVTLFILSFTFAAPVYLFAGIPLSMMIDWIVGKISDGGQVKEYFYRVFLYVIAGIVAMTLFTIVMLGEELSNGFLVGIFYSPIVLFSSGASLLYFHILLLIQLIFRKAEKKLADLEK
ncbi:hypothetical protein [Brevibacillus daliensis]|uniref:hypothetical protein n=1 Tax=Brevibacillus daliensis TaxID=2892995 RepID=UPI001E2DDCDF|nr:hypothetical protein [Brevibacillus daliensis]